VVEISGEHDAHSSEGGVMRVKVRVIVTTFVILSILASRPATAEESAVSASCFVKAKSCVPSQFIKQARSKSLANPAILVTDPATGVVLYENRPDSPSVPASVMKVLTSYTALTFLGGDKRFSTSIYRVETGTTFMLLGERDPWLTMFRSVSLKYGPAFAPDLINVALSQFSDGDRPKRITVLHSRIYPADLSGLKAHFKDSEVRVTFKEISSKEAKLKTGEPLYQILSPTVNQMVEFLIRFSDNRLADRLAIHAAIAHGYQGDKSGLQESYQDALLAKEIGIDGLNVEDGSGLSKQNRVTSRMVVDLLTKIRGLPEYQSLYQGLPTSGKTGTLKKRFKESAPDAVGLVKAKTGWVNGSVSLAGFITSGEKEYAFAVLADRIPRYYSATERARAAIDRMIGSLAKPATTQILEAIG
jgi:D-alanyl-D-alanine carboxypeptidase/D-alanyl-D-alanine-endopeptidase (penicillin-binding protein 4)